MDLSRIPVTPKKPADCKRHRWARRFNLRTGELLDGDACWHCGTPAPDEAEPVVKHGSAA